MTTIWISKGFCHVTPLQIILRPYLSLYFVIKVVVNIKWISNLSRKIPRTNRLRVDVPRFYNVNYTGWRKKNACPLAPTLTRFICLRFPSLGLPQIKSLRSKTSYSRRSESFHSRRNCNCATRNVSKCDAELWGEAPDVCTARRTPSFRYNFP